MTQKDLSGKVAVITGGASGIGKAAAQALAERGVKVVIGDISVEQGETTVKEINAKIGDTVAAFKKTDVSTYQDNIQLFQLAEREFGGVDIAFLNAGSGKGWDSVFAELDDETEEKVFKTNTMGVVKGTKVALLHMAKRGSGVIINTSSIGGLHSALSAVSYCASKHAVVGWTRGFDDLPRICNVRVNAVCPGYIDTTNFMSSAFVDNEIRTPLLRLNPITPTVSLDTVVKAVMTFIEDETLNGETWYALPGDVIRPQARMDYPVECTSPEYLAAAVAMDGESIAYYKNLLQQAQEKYAEKVEKEHL